MNKLFYLLFLFLLSPLAFAQYGNTGVQMQGQAGAYKVLVDVQPPKTIPGNAQVYIEVETIGITQVEARSLYFHSTPADTATYEKLGIIAKQSGHFKGDVYLTKSGSTAIQIRFSGSKGSGELIVPVKVIPGLNTSSDPISLGLLVLGLILLTLLFIPIPKAKTGSLFWNTLRRIQPDKKHKIRYIAVAGLAGAIIFYGANNLWNGKKPLVNNSLHGSASVLDRNSQRIFQINIDTTNWVSQKKAETLSMLIPDHGKLMHAFLLRTPTLDVFAHLHPERIDSTTFEASFPQLPAGKYLVYADIVQHTGVTETITDTIVIGEVDKKTSITPDETEDTFVITDPINAPGNASLDADVIICGKPGTKTVFKDGSYAVWAGRPDQALEVGKPYHLDFEIYNPDGSACLPEPYLGIMGHVMVIKSDGSVYNHLHPSGTFPAVAEKIYTNQNRKSALAATAFKDSVDRHLSRLKGMSMLEREEFLMTEMGMYDLNENGMVGMDHGSLISFPYTFPKEGRYRIFLQVKRNEKVMTGAFDVKVKKGSSQK